MYLLCIILLHTCRYDFQSRTTVEPEINAEEDTIQSERGDEDDSDYAVHVSAAVDPFEVQLYDDQ